MDRNTILWNPIHPTSLSTVGIARPGKRRDLAFVFHCVGFPYSEHSSFDELKGFIEYLKPKRIIPT